jgi:hypothetical protein
MREPTTVAGLEIVLPEGTPLAALVVLKYLDEDGDHCYSASSTDGLSAVEALGMAVLANIRLRELLREDAE